VPAPLDEHVFVHHHDLVGMHRWCRAGARWRAGPTIHRVTHTAPKDNATPPRPPPAEPWQDRNFRWLWSGLFVSTLGSHAAGIAYPLLVLALTGSPEVVGWVTALRITPFVLLSLPVGAMVDRWDRRRVMLWCDVGRGLVVGSLPLAMLWGTPTLAHIVAVAVVEGSLMVFYNLAEVAALPRVVARPRLPQASAINQAGFAAAGVAGPALGTALYQASRALPFAADALSYAVSAFTLWRLRGDFSPVPATQPRHLGAEVIAGLRWLWHEKIVRRLALLTGGMNFVVASVPLLLIVMAQRMGASAVDVGLIFSAGGVGGVLGSVVGGYIQRYIAFGRVIGGVVLLRALLFPLYAASPSPLWLGVVYALFEFLGPVYNVVQFSHRIALIPHGLEGRVNAGYRFIAHALNPVGAALCGVLIERVGAGRTLAFYASALGLLAAAALSSRTIRNEPNLAAT
jgi:predicted MFS family arabinose efflux permease